MARISDLVRTPETEINVFPVPDGGYRYRDAEGRLSRDRYANAQSARHDARRPQYADKDGRVEPLDRAVKHGRFA